MLCSAGELGGEVDLREQVERVEAMRAARESIDDAQREMRAATQAVAAARAELTEIEARSAKSNQSGVAGLAKALREPVAALGVALPAYRRVLIDEVKRLDQERVVLLLDAADGQ